MHQKIVNIEELSEIVSKLKIENKTIAHCHGCFDLMHLGHIKHFKSAKSMADILIVTITPDQYVNKGPGRPVFNELQRAEAIASLQCVDYVAVNKWPTAVETIRLIKPSVYIKGPDYKDQTQDITGNIKLEENAVKDVGGIISYTEDITFSSTKLINEHFSPHNDHTKQYLQKFKKRYSSEDIIKEIDNLKNLNVLVIGDTIIDEYHYCKPLGKSSKSPTISSVFLKGESYAGGVLAIANHLDQFANKVDLVSCVGKENSQIDFINNNLSDKINRTFFEREDGPTPTKRRYLDRYLNIKLFEVTFMNDHYIDTSLEHNVIEFLKSKIKEYNVVLIADFGHGLITPNIIQFLEQSGVFLAVNAQTNSNNYGFNYITKYSKVSYISIDEKELRLPFGDNYGKIETLISKLASICNCNNIQITLGQEGSIVFHNNSFNSTPAFATLIKDSVGAGDAVLSVTSLLAYNNVPAEVAAFIGNSVGAIAVEIIGNEHPVYKKDLQKFIISLLK